MTDQIPKTQQPCPVVLVTGPSGAGRSTAIRALEDLEQPRFHAKCAD